MHRVPRAAITLFAMLHLGLALAGCAPKATPGCLRYVACQSAYDAAAGHNPKDTSAYAEGGLCWGDGATAARCAQECDEALVALQAAAAAGRLDVAACAP